MNDLIEILLFIGFLVLVVELTAHSKRVAEGDKAVEEEFKKRCPPHTWGYEEGGRMRCQNKNCGFVAGQE